MAHPSLQGKIALVTGGSRGIGAAIAVEFAKRGAAGVIITYVSNEAAAGKVVGQIQSLGSKSMAIRSDAGEPHTGRDVVRQVIAGYGGIDILVNNAGVAHFVPFQDASVEDYARNFDVNFRGPMLTTQAILQHIRPGGRIIMITSKASRLNLGDPYSLYGASKAALENFTRSVATEFAARKQITINSIMPGAVDTDMIAPLVDAAATEHLKTLPTAEKRMGKVDDIAQIAGFLAEEGSRWLNGVTLSATGGEVML